MLVTFYYVSNFTIFSQYTCLEFSPPVRKRMYRVNLSFLKLVQMLSMSKIDYVSVCVVA